MNDEPQGGRLLGAGEEATPCGREGLHGLVGQVRQRQHPGQDYQEGKLRLSLAFRILVLNKEPAFVRVSRIHRRRYVGAPSPTGTASSHEHPVPTPLS